jgi:hypothetical protein
MRSLRVVEKFTRAKAEPALALSIQAKPSELDNGLLTASEVATLKLTADFVVLSPVTGGARRLSARSMREQNPLWFRIGPLIVKLLLSSWTDYSQRLRQIPVLRAPKRYGRR